MRHSKSVRAGLCLAALLLLGLGSTGGTRQSQRAAASPAQAMMQEYGLHAPVEGAAADVGRVTGSAQVRAGFDEQPDAAAATVVDARAPAWTTRYGTRAGAALLEPQNLPAGLSPTGPEVEVGGWRTFDLGGNADIRGIAAAADGRLFAGVNGVGVYVYARGASGVYAWSLIAPSAGGLISSAVNDVAVSGDLLWVATTGFGISQLNLATGIWSTLTTSNTTLPSVNVRKLFAESSVPGAEEFYAATDSGAWRYYTDPRDGPGGTAYFAGQVVNHAMSHVLNGTRVEWVATENGLWRDDGSGWVKHTGSAACSLDSANAMAADFLGGVWFAAYRNTPALSHGDGVEADAAAAAPSARIYDGICRYYGGAWSRYTSLTPGLPTDFAVDLRSDAEGRVWMAFSDPNPDVPPIQGGAAVYDQGTWLIFKKSLGDPLAADQVNFVAPVGESVWFGFRGKAAVTQYSNNWARFTNAETGGIGPATTVFIDNTETWIGRGTGVAYFDGFDWIERSIPNNVSPVSRIARMNQLWVGTRGSGLFQFDGTSFIPHRTAEGLGSDDVRDVVVDQSFRVWVATAGGLNLWAGQYWLRFTADNSPLGTNDLTALTVGTDGRIYIGTNGDGLYVLNPSAEIGAHGVTGEEAWTHVPVADGLPGAVITALAVEPRGAVWAVGPTGHSRRDPETRVWTKSGTVPTTSVAIDPSGRVWLGDESGLWRFAGGVWTLLKRTSTLLDSERITAVAADGSRSWFVSGGELQARADFNGPIGFVPPFVNTIAPPAAVVDTSVTMTGGGYDARRNGNNIVSFGNLSDPTTYGDVTSVAPLQIAAKVPLLARSGKVWVRANRLNGASASDFTVLPGIRNVTPTCAALGSAIAIEGSGFNSGTEAAYVKVGNGPWRVADSQTPGSIRQFVRPGDTDGPISVRVGQSGVVISSAASVVVDSPVIDQVGIQQAVQGLPMIWPKRTLVLLSMRSSRGLCGTRVDGGQLEFKLKNGSAVEDWKSFQPSPAGLMIGPNRAPLGVNTSLSFVLWGDSLLWPTYSLADFDGVRLRLTNGPVELVTYEIPAASFNFADLGNKRKHLNVYVYNTAETGDAAWDAFYKNANTGLEHVARVYPQSDIEPYYGPNQWMHWAFRTIGKTGSVDLSDDDNFYKLQEEVEDVRSANNDNGHRYAQAMGIIATSLYAGRFTGKAVYECSNPFADCDIHSAVAYNTAGKLANTWLQESIHTLTWVKPGSANHATANRAHSKYINKADDGSCPPEDTFRRALMDQLGYAARAVRIEAGKPPFQFQMGNCELGQMPASVMAYSAPRDNTNAYLEPLDYLYVFRYLSVVAQLTGGQMEVRQSGAPSQALRLNGRISAGPGPVVDISMSYLDAIAGELSAPMQAGPYTLTFLGAGGASVGDFPFDVPAGHTHGTSSGTDHRFSLRVPFPEDTSAIAIVHDGEELWRQSVSANPPTVSLTSPSAQASYNATDPLSVAWNASDPDGDELAFTLDYSADDGATWETVATGLGGSGYEWTPAFVPVGVSRLRLAASDGFNTAEAVSEQFYVQPASPLAVILSPADGEVILEGGPLSMSANAVASQSQGDVVEYNWYLDGAFATSGQTVAPPYGDVGTHTLGLQVVANGLPSVMNTITIEVVGDYDGDGLSNAYENQHGLNPLDRSDSAADPDGDGLTTLEESRLGTSPILEDSDADGISDGDELAMGSDPSDAGNRPPAGASLNVGATSLGFVYLQGGTLPAPQDLWMTNAGPGTLAWTVTGGAPWLAAAPAAGTAAGSSTLTAAPAGLAPGFYSVDLTVSAVDGGGQPALGSPQLVNVWLAVYAADGTMPGVVPTATPTATATVPPGTPSPTATPTATGTTRPTGTPTRTGTPPTAGTPGGTSVPSPTRSGPLPYAVYLPYAVFRE